ncbi:sulfur carrier protein ThiS [Sphaerotilus hippei]|uniref:Sulfur carrier protein ThiS n=1 Tax=Sphaerotilus hippei TaxID=744406 RepID=A0A318H3F6_9BURK|nr:sulfur carrier protein ThiS [Sphaerotilus hippei]PXW98076.1 sulfur carrier protein ThiS [Sphaerotilus hippei]
MTPDLTPAGLDLIEVSINGEPLAVPPASSLDGALECLGERLDPRRCATAVNGQFVPRAARAARLLQPGDTITTFQAIVGG